MEFGQKNIFVGRMFDILPCFERILKHEEGFTNSAALTSPLIQSFNRQSIMKNKLKYSVTLPCFSLFCLEFTFTGISIECQPPAFQQSMLHSEQV